MSDGSGLVVGVRSGAHRAAAIAAALRARFGVPVVATLAGQDQPQYCVFDKEDTLSPPTRCDDHPSFWGGNVIQHTDELGTYGCSGGFGVHGSSGQPYLLTAMHCADSISGYTNGLTFYNGQDPGHWTRIGQITDVGGTVDAAIIPASAGNRYYDGPGIYSGDTRDNKIVSGQLAVSVADDYCESGAFGGVKCGFIVLQTNVSLRDPVVVGHVWTDLVTATSSTGQFPIEGDSGGPWFSLNGCCYAWARGITWGVLFDTGKKYALFTPLTAASTKTGVTVNGS